MDSSFCTIHNTKLYPSKFDDGKFYHFINGDKANGVCHGEGVGQAVRNGRADSQTGKPVVTQNSSYDSMLICNAANNATALLASTGAFTFEDWDSTFKHIYQELLLIKNGTT